MENNISLFGEDIKRTFLFHIPHSSKFVPNWNYVPSRLLNEIRRDIMLSTDWKTDEIFNVEGITKHIAKFSRVFCDVERFITDDMDKFGRGIYYTLTKNGTHLRDFNLEHYNYILENYYKPHHNEFSNLTNNILNNEGIVRIVDCHSFNEHRLPFETFDERPDICIGVDEFHTPQYLIDVFMLKFESCGFSVDINSPYSGTIVPLEHYKKNKNVESIMIEINKKLYFNKNVIDLQKVSKLQQIISSIFEF